MSYIFDKAFDYIGWVAFGGVAFWVFSIIYWIKFENKKLKKLLMIIPLIISFGLLVYGAKGLLSFTSDSLLREIVVIIAIYGYVIGIPLFIDILVLIKREEKDLKKKKIVLNKDTRRTVFLIVYIILCIYFAIRNILALVVLQSLIFFISSIVLFITYCIQLLKSDNK